MFYCKNCGEHFEEPKKIYETHVFTDTPFEIFYVCPHCQSGNYRETVITHCRCCGGKLPAGKEEYCSESCRRKGEKLWKKQLERHRSVLRDPLQIVVKECIDYNAEHHTHYSYGRYVALIRPILLKEKRKCDKKKRST